MSMLPAGEPLHRFVHDVDAFMYDPEGYLRVAPIEVGPRRMFGLAALFGLPGLGLIFYWLASSDRNADFEALAIGIALLCGAGIWFGWSLRMTGHKLLLLPEGVQIIYKDSAVCCPWALFNAEGAPFIAESDSPLVGLSLPVDPRAIPYVELRQNDSPVSFGRQVRARQFGFASGNVVVLPARYAMRAEDLGFLLMQLGSRLGRQLPKETPPREAFQDEPAGSSSIEADADGWITVHLSQLDLPERCCTCLVQTQEKFPLYASARWHWMGGFGVHDVKPLVVGVPICPACKETVIHQQIRGGSRGMQFGALISVLIYTFLMWGGPLEGSLLIMGALGVLAVGGLIGFLVGNWLGSHRPAELRRYSPAYGTVQLRFLNPEYTDLVLKEKRSRSH